MSPMESWASDIVAIRIALMALPSHFRRRKKRKVEARFMSLDDRVELFYDGSSIGYAQPVDLAANGRSYREWEV